MLRFFLRLTLALGLSGSAAAIDESELLPIDEAFALNARAVAPDRIELEWRIAEGYYLYRHRMSAAPADSALVADPLVLPEGTKKTDEFFGEVQTFRDRVVGTLALLDPVRARAIELRVKYQGCADAGVCYPPHTKLIQVSMDADVVAAGARVRGPALPGVAAAPNILSQPLANPNKPLLGGPDIDIAPVEAQLLPAEQAFGFEAIAASPSALLLRFTPAPGYYLYRDRSAFKLIDSPDAALDAPRWPPGSAHEDAHFGKVIVYFDQIEVPLPLKRSAAAALRVTLEATFQGCETDGICYPPMTRRVDIELPAAAAESLVDAAQLAAVAETVVDPTTGQKSPSRSNPAADTPGLFASLLLALLGGLILNLMPCVLPVLSLKVLGIVGSGESATKARAHALWYTAGVLAAFAAVGAAAIALRHAGLALGWGFQLQQPLVVAVLAYVLFAVGLSLSGVFQMGAGLAGMGQALTEKTGPTGDFFTGVLAVVVAAPCTAPFMGAALAYAFAAPTAVAILVFLALGLGLALPFLVVGFVPAVARVLPRPGAWMDVLKQLFAFPMYLTAAWLVWVLAKQRGADAVGWVLIGAILLAASLWALERLRGLSHPALRLIAVLVALVALWPLWKIWALESDRASVNASATQPAADASLPYSAERLETLRAQGRVIFVNMTADWCVTCKVNENTVFALEAFRVALERFDAAYLKGDWTDVDPRITRFLESHHAVGVPLYVVYGPASAAGEVLPTVLTLAMVEAALARAGK